MHYYIKTKSIELRHDFRNGEYYFALCNSEGGELWYSGNFKLLPGDSARLVFEEETPVPIGQVDIS